MNICQNLQQLRQTISAIEQNVSHKSTSVKLLAVSKTKPVSAILEAYQSGQIEFGENYVQEGIEKIQYFQEQNIALQWHFIGALQSNKTRLVAEHFDWVQTVERTKIADRLNEQRPYYKSPLNVLIQINISNEASKAGIQPTEMLALAKHIAELPHLKLRGLMAIPAPTENLEEQKQAFQTMQNLFIQLQQALPHQQIDTLSMGMTDDMQMAIECGSTMVRIGTAIFGAREYA